MISKRSGVALPTVILLLLCMTAAVMGAFARAGAEVRTVDNQRAQTAAFAVAQAGLHRYLARGRTQPADTTITVPGGKARVRVSVARATATSDTVMYLIRSDGVVAGGVQLPEGRRTVAEYAYYVRGTMNVNAAWTAFGPLNKAGSSGMITGQDACSFQKITGVRSPADMFTYSGDTLIVPLGGGPALDERGTLGELAAEVKIDWPSIANPGASTLSFDIVICYPGTKGYDARWGPCSSWPAATSWNEGEYWPTILVNGSSALPERGRGMLVVTGDLDLGGGDRWDGVLLVGNRLVDNGAGTVSGAVFSGMNALSGATVDPSDANGTKSYRYDSCAVTKAAAQQSRFLPMSNAWVDNMATW
jgi:hypothetical protein